MILQKRVLTDVPDDVPEVPDCPVMEYGGFLKRVCSDERGTLTLQCHNSKERYTVGSFRLSIIAFWYKKQVNYGSESR